MREGGKNELLLNQEVECRLFLGEVLIDRVQPYI